MTSNRTVKPLAAAPESGLSKSIQEALSLILLTGCRGGEAVAASWDDIDLDNGEWRLPETKNGNPPGSAGQSCSCAT